MPMENTANSSISQSTIPIFPRSMRAGHGGLPKKPSSQANTPGFAGEHAWQPVLGRLSSLHAVAEPACQAKAARQGCDVMGHPPEPRSRVGDRDTVVRRLEQGDVV